MRCVEGMSVTTQDHEDKHQRAHSCVHQVCHVIVGFHVLCVDLGFHVCHWCRTSHRSAGRFYTSTSFHHAHAIPSTKFFLLDVVVRRCPVIINSICIPNSCIVHIVKTGLLRCCLYILRHICEFLSISHNCLCSSFLR